MVFLEKKKLGNFVYYYHSKSIRFGSQVKKLRRYIGKNINQAKSIKEIIKTSEEFADIEFNLIENNFNINSITYSKEILKDIFKSNTLITNLKKIDDNLNIKIKKTFQIEFIYNSNSIEGSKIALKDVEKLLNGRKAKTKNKNEIKEVLNSFECWNYLEKDFKFNILSIKKLHKLLTKNLLNQKEDQYKQGFKKINIVVGFDNRPTTQPNQIKPELKKLFNWYNKNKKTMFPPLLAFEFYFKYELIHPFQDGNGRTGRLIMNKILMNNKFQPMVVFTENSQSHHRAFVRGEKGNMKYFYDFMLKQYKKTNTKFYKKFISEFYL